MVADKSGDARLDATGADCDEAEAQEESGAGTFEEGERSMSQTVKERDDENCPIAPEVAVGKPAAEQGQEIHSGHEKVSDFFRAALAHVHHVLEVEREDGQHPVVTEAFAGFVAYDVLYLWREARVA